MKNRKREICTSGTVRDEDGNILIYSACARKSPGREDDSNLKPFVAIRGFDSLPVKASQPAGSELCMGGGNTIREA